MTTAERTERATPRRRTGCCVRGATFSGERRICFRRRPDDRPLPVHAHGASRRVRILFQRHETSPHKRDLKSACRGARGRFPGDGSLRGRRRDGGYLAAGPHRLVGDHDVHPPLANSISPPSTDALANRELLRLLPSLHPPTERSKPWKFDRLEMVRFGLGPRGRASGALRPFVDVRADEGESHNSREVARRLPVAPGEVALGTFADGAKGGGQSHLPIRQPWGLGCGWTASSPRACALPEGLPLPATNDPGSDCPSMRTAYVARRSRRRVVRPAMRAAQRAWRAGGRHPPRESQVSRGAAVEQQRQRECMPARGSGWHPSVNGFGRRRRRRFQETPVPNSQAAGQVPIWSRDISYVRARGGLVLGRRRLPTAPAAGFGISRARAGEPRLAGC